MNDDRTAATDGDAAEPAAPDADAGAGSPVQPTPDGDAGEPTAAGVSADASEPTASAESSDSASADDGGLLDLDPPIEPGSPDPENALFVLLGALAALAVLVRMAMLFG